LVVAVRLALVALLVMVTVAFGITAPDSSVTTPLMYPVGACASKLTAQQRYQNASHRRCFQNCLNMVYEPP